MSPSSGYINATPLGHTPFESSLSTVKSWRNSCVIDEKHLLIKEMYLMQRNYTLDIHNASCQRWTSSITLVHLWGSPFCVSTLDRKNFCLCLPIQLRNFLWTMIFVIYLLLNFWKSNLNRGYCNRLDMEIQILLLYSENQRNDITNIGIALCVMSCQVDSATGKVDPTVLSCKNDWFLLEPAKTLPYCLLMAYVPVE